MNGSPAFSPYGMLENRQPLGDRAIAAPEPTNHIGPLAISPVRVTDGSAGNRMRAAVVKCLYEYARWRGGMAAAGYPYLVTNPDQFGRIPNRRLARVPRFAKVIPNTRAAYVPAVYGGQVRTIIGG